MLARLPSHANRRPANFCRSGRERVQPTRSRIRALLEVWSTLCDRNGPMLERGPEHPDDENSLPQARIGTASSNRAATSVCLRAFPDATICCEHVPESGRPA